MYTHTSTLQLHDFSYQTLVWMNDNTNFIPCLYLCISELFTNATALS